MCTQENARRVETNITLVLTPLQKKKNRALSDALADALATSISSQNDNQPHTRESYVEKSTCTHGKRERESIKRGKNRSILPMHRLSLSRSNSALSYPLRERFEAGPSVSSSSSLTSWSSTGVSPSAGAALLTCPVGFSASSASASP